MLIRELQSAAPNRQPITMPEARLYSRVVQALRSGAHRPENAKMECGLVPRRRVSVSSGGVGAVVRSLTPNPEVPGSIPGLLVEG